MQAALFSKANFVWEKNLSPSALKRIQVIFCGIKSPAGFLLTTSSSALSVSAMKSKPAGTR